MKNIHTTIYSCNHPALKELKMILDSGATPGAHFVDKKVYNSLVASVCKKPDSCAGLNYRGVKIKPIMCSDGSESKKESEWNVTFNKYGRNLL
jgi:hypothetical protein